MNKNTKPQPAASPVVPTSVVPTSVVPTSVVPTPFALSPTVPIPPGQHMQAKASENRVIMQSIGVTSGFGKTSDVVSPNSSAMMLYANTVLRSSTLPQITKVYTPNEMASLLHDLQTRLGL